MSESLPYEEVAARMYAKDPVLATEMLNECLLDNDMEGFLLALRHMTKAYGGIANVAKATGLHEKTLYKTLSNKGNPNLKTLMLLIGTLGLRMTFMPNENAFEKVQG